VKYFELQCRYFDFDDKVFGEITEKFIIEKFYNIRRIDVLNVFPLIYYSIREKKEYFIIYDRKFVFMIDCDYFYYESNAFFEKLKRLIRISIKFKIIIDVDLFRKINSNYFRLFIKKSNDVAVDLYL
jgi:hypothetical protein